jgi:hypothetical protein
MAEDWGSRTGAFNTDWLLRTSQGDAIVDRYYDGQDFCDGSGHAWGYVAHRDAICQANEPGRMVVLYGVADAARRRLSEVDAVALDLRIPAAREWNARRLLSRLLDLGFDAGESACVILGAKPGFWAYYDGPAPSARPRRRTRGQASFRERAPVLGRASRAHPWARGYEAALNEQMRAVLLLAPRAGPQAATSTAGARSLHHHRGPGAEVKWSVWEDDVLTWSANGQPGDRTP